MGAYQEFQDDCLAGAMRSTGFAREVAKALVVFRRSNDETVHSIHELLGILDNDRQDLLTAARSFDLEPEARKAMLRATLVMLAVDIWRAALDLGVASMADPGNPAMIRQPAPIDHPALDLAHQILDVKGWEPFRASECVEFLDDEGRHCEVVVRPLDDDDEGIESEGEVHPGIPGEGEDDDAVVVS